MLLDNEIGPPPSAPQYVAAIHNLQVQLNCILGALGVLAVDARPDTLKVAVNAVRISAEHVKSPFYPGREDELGLKEAAREIADKIAKLLESGH